MIRQRPGGLQEHSRLILCDGIHFSAGSLLGLLVYKVINVDTDRELNIAISFFEPLKHFHLGNSEKMKRISSVNFGEKSWFYFGG